MKIAYLSPTFPPLLGGMGTACYYTANEIGKSHEVTVFLAERGVNYQTGNYKINLINPWFSCGHGHFMPQVLWLLKDFDIVHLYYPYFGVAEFLWLIKKIRRNKIKIVFHHAMEAVGQGWIKYIFKFHTKFIMPLLMKSADMIFVLSRDYAEHSDITKIYQRYPEKFREVPHGVDIDKFKKQKTNNKKQKLNLNEDAFIVFTAQALDKAHFFKGIDVLIKAFKIIDDLLLQRDPSSPRFAQVVRTSLKLLIAGDGDLKSYYQDLAVKLDVSKKIIFLGNIDHKDLPIYYNLAAVTAVPSTERTECFSITAVESMACGTPVVVSNWPGLRVTIENNKSGLMVKPKDVNDLAEKLLFFINNPEKIKEFGEKARKRVEERFDWHVIVHQVIKYYNDLTRLRPLRP